MQRWEQCRSRPAVLLPKDINTFCCSNNDTTVAPDFVEAMVKAAETDPKIGMVGAKIYYFSSPNIIWSAGGKVDFGQPEPFRHIGENAVDQGQYDQPGEVCWATGCCLLVRSETLKQIGLLDEIFGYYCEDVDWCLRAKKAGWKLWYEPRAKIWHKIGQSTGRGSLAVRYYNCRNILLVARRNLSWPKRMGFYLRAIKWARQYPSSGSDKAGIIEATVCGILGRGGLATKIGNARWSRGRYICRGNFKGSKEGCFSSHLTGNRSTVWIKRFRMNVVYDISVFGTAELQTYARSGIYRVVENLARALMDSGQCSIHYSAFEEYFFNHTLKHLQSSSEYKAAFLPRFVHPKAYYELTGQINKLNNRVSAAVGIKKTGLRTARKLAYLARELVDPESRTEKILQKAGIYHSPYFSIPERVRKHKKLKPFLTIYDLIPILHPQFFEAAKDGGGHFIETLVNGIGREDGVICISQKTKEDLCNYRKDLDPDRVFVTHLGASNWFYPCKDSLAIEKSSA